MERDPENNGKGDREYLNKTSTGLLPAKICRIGGNPWQAGCAVEERAESCVAVAVGGHLNHLLYPRERRSKEDLALSSLLYVLPHNHRVPTPPPSSKRN